MHMTYDGDKMDPRDIKVLALKCGIQRMTAAVTVIAIIYFYYWLREPAFTILCDPYCTISEKHVWPLFVLKSFAWWGSEHLSLQMPGVLPRSFHSPGPVAGFCSSCLLTSLLLGGSCSPTFLMCVRPCDLPRPKRCKQTCCVTPGRASNTGWSKQGLSPWMNVMSWGPLVTVIEMLWVRNKLSHSNQGLFTFVIVVQPNPSLSLQA